MRIRKRTPARAASPGPTRHRAESPPPPPQQLKVRYLPPGGFTCSWSLLLGPALFISVLSSRIVVPVFVEMPSSAHPLRCLPFWAQQERPHEEVEEEKASLPVGVGGEEDPVPAASERRCV
jgi:hypothetical protein